MYKPQQHFNKSPYNSQKKHDATTDINLVPPKKDAESEANISPRQSFEFVPH